MQFKWNRDQENAESPDPNRVDLKAALTAMRALANNPDDTAQVFRIVESLSGPSAQKQFVRFSQTLPHAALCFRGWRIPPSGRWRDSQTIFGTRVDAPMSVDIITGCGGYLVKPGFFDEEVFDHDAAPPSAFFVDDIWISGHLARRGILRYVIPSPAAFVYLPTLTTWRTPGLDRTDNAAGSRHNDVILDYFRSVWGRMRSR